MHHSRPGGIDDILIRGICELTPPYLLLDKVQASAGAMANIRATRNAIERILRAEDDRLLVVVGPCSIHDCDAGIEYAQLLAEQRKRLELLIVMRVYFEKPRTTLGWKGLINDPCLDNSYRINDGLELARRFLLAVNELGLPAGTEFLDSISPQYIADLISWGAIGARTTESQVHRELASGLSCPIGFKNGTDGNVRIAAEAILAAASPHHFLGVTKQGHAAIISTAGNRNCHVVLRGGKTPNFDEAGVSAACDELADAGLLPRVMIDCSHGNSHKMFRQQAEVARHVAARIAEGENRILGLMLESHLLEGRQDLVSGTPLQYGKSITDACLGWEDTVMLLELLAGAASKRRSRVMEHSPPS